jgi:hypothetical protein
MARGFVIFLALSLVACSSAFMASPSSLPLRASAKVASTRSHVCSALKMSGDHHDHVEQVDRGSFIYTYAAVVGSPFIALLAKQVIDKGAAEAPKAAAPKAEAPKAAEK